jgi:hypothetical protein
MMITTYDVMFILYKLEYVMSWKIIVVYRRLFYPIRGPMFESNSNRRRLPGGFCPVWTFPHLRVEDSISKWQCHSLFPVLN